MIYPLSSRIRTTMVATLFYTGWLVVLLLGALKPFAAFFENRVHATVPSFVGSVVAQNLVFFALGLYFLKSRVSPKRVPQLLVATLVAATLTIVLIPVLLFVGLQLALLSVRLYRPAYLVVNVLAWICPGLIAAQILRFPRNRAPAISATTG